MPNESQDHQSIKEDTMNIEIEPRPTSRAGTTPEARNDTDKLGLPRADIDDGNGQAGIMPSQAPGSTAQSAHSSPDESCVQGRLGQEGESQSHTSEEVIDDNVHTIDLNDQALLSAIKELLVPKIEGARLVEEDSTLGVSGFRWMQDMFHGDSNSANLGYFWWMSDEISDSWPTRRDVKGVRQYLIESCKEEIKTRAHWSSLPWVQDTHYDSIESLWLDWCSKARNRLQKNVSRRFKPRHLLSMYRYEGKIIYCVLNTFRKGAQGFPISLLACALSFEEPFRLSRSEMNRLDARKSTSFLSTAFRGGYNVQTDHDLHNIIHWQVRYFSPMYEYEEPGIKCLFSQRETVTIQHGLDKTVLQEKRAVVSFRVLRNAPDLFSILVLKDEDMCPDVQSPDQQFDFETFWKGYEGIEADYITPLTYYLLEICRVFKMCMDAWEKTLSTIDKLVLVKLEDLDDLERVEELMFDNSFKRSKDYFVALQILRIIDEWLDEVLSTVEDMSKDAALLEASMWEYSDSVRSDSYFEVAIRYVKEHATATKSRVRKKHEEINSLRDGLFNATSLRESTKAMALNQAIYVFTIVTVLFTPVSFLATFWALPFLNNPADGSGTIPEPSAFRNSFIIMPILTYALVIGLAWFVGRRSSANALLGLMTKLGRIIGQLMRSTRNSVRLMLGKCWDLLLLIEVRWRSE